MKFEVVQTFLLTKKAQFTNNEGETVEFYKAAVEYPDDLRVSKVDRKLFEQLSRGRFPQTVKCYYDPKFDKFFGKE